MTTRERVSNASKATLKRVGEAAAVAVILAIGAAVAERVETGALIQFVGGAPETRLETLEQDVKALPAVDALKTSFVARAPGQPNAWPDLDNYVAPSVPEQAQTYTLDLRCVAGFEPVATWHAVTGSHPEIDVMYSIHPQIDRDSGAIRVALRSRQAANGYAYVDVFVLCRRAAGQSQGL